MVSFNCDGCGDVVKKPKLSQHYNRCYAPFTCLDCSIQFMTPKEAHSSCITEDEKYQKSTYKGKKQNPVAEVSKSFVPTRDSIESPIVPKKADSTKREREPERSTNVASKKFRSEDSKDTTSQGKINSTHEEDKDAKGNPTISVKDALDASALPKYVAALSGSQSKVTLSDLVKYISKEKGIPKSELKRRLLKKMKLSVQDGRVTFV